MNVVLWKMLKTELFAKCERSVRRPLAQLSTRP
jgi:hypothetical protein